MPSEDYRCLSVEVDAGVAFVTFDHPPLNLMDLSLIQELAFLGPELEADDRVRVIVFQSADPEFFIAHADVSMIRELGAGAPPDPDEPNFFQEMVERFRRMDKVSIAKIEGCCRGGGSELVLSLDMRFAAIGRARLSQPEVAIGIIPGGGGTQRLPRLIGRGRALEAILGAGDFDAETAERYGWVNRALPPGEIGPFVDALARRVASFNPETVALAKRAVGTTEPDPRWGLVQEAGLFNQSLATEGAQTGMRRFLTLGGQTREVELELESLLGALADTDDAAEDS